MLSRGYLVGESIDELAVLATQAQMRAKLGLTDLHIFVENFFRDLLGIMNDAKYVNANKERSNTPGVDLLCDSLGYAVQVTTLKTSDKVEKSLEAFCTRYQTKYKRLIILILGVKQTSYSIDSDLLKKSGFNPEADIWDVTNLGHQILDLELDRLQELYGLIKKSVIKVRIEMEIPNELGEFPTTAYSHIEAAANPKLGSVQNLMDYVEGPSETPRSANDVKPYDISLRQWSTKLSKLPRVTREFIAILLEYRDKEGEDSYGGIRVNHSKIARLMKGFDIEGELGILQDYEIINIDPPEEGRNCAQITFPFYHGVDGFLVHLCQFVENSETLDLRRVIGNLNFEGF